MLSEAGVSEGHKILDIGSGSGTFSIPAAKLVGNYGLIYALDTSRGALKRLSNKVEKEGLENINTLLSSGSVDIPLDTETINHVFLIDVLQEVSEKGSLFKEVYRVLQKDGHVIIYPMHIDANEVIKLASDTGFRLKDRIFQEQVLLFEKI
jgi:ubiquinone/menaquinone biosynthesis C-methylase UbiE